MEKEFKKVIGIVALKVLAEIKKETPVKTGRLRNSITLKQEGDTFIIGTNVNYAEAVELGVGPYEITPKDKKALYWKGAAHPVKRVKHPGFDGRFMFLKGAKKFKSILQQELNK